MNCRLMGLHIQSEPGETDPFVDETRRRVFWACWMNRETLHFYFQVALLIYAFSECIGQENASFKGDPWKDAIGLRFLSDEESWHAKRPSSKEMFDDKGNIVNFDGSDVTPIISEGGEFIKLLSLW